MNRETLGQLEQLLMLAVARLGAEAYGAAIQRMLEETAGRSASIATIYVTLVRLEKKGYVRSRREGPTPVRGKRGYFRSTPRHRRLKESRLPRMRRPPPARAGALMASTFRSFFRSRPGLGGAVESSTPPSRARLGPGPGNPRLVCARCFLRLDSAREPGRSHDSSSDVRYAFRSLWRSPGFTTVVVVTLGLGIGVNVALMSVLRAVLLRPLPYGGEERVDSNWSQWNVFPKTWVALEEYGFYRDTIQSFDGWRSMRGQQEPHGGQAGARRHRPVTRISSKYSGRGGSRRVFSAEKCPPIWIRGGGGCGCPVHRIWQRRRLGSRNRRPPRRLTPPFSRSSDPAGGSAPDRLRRHDSTGLYLAGSARRHRADSPMGEVTGTSGRLGP
jgi:DNA-binding PadR family transcriptional regulator